MQRSTAKRRVATAAPQAAIALQAPGGRDERTRFGLALIVFMRVTAALWIAQGLLQWSSVLTTGPDGLSLFATLAPAAIASAPSHSLSRPLPLTARPNAHPSFSAHPHPLLAVVLFSTAS